MQVHSFDNRGMREVQLINVEDLRSRRYVDLVDNLFLVYLLFQDLMHEGKKVNITERNA